MIAADPNDVKQAVIKKIGTEEYDSDCVFSKPRKETRNEAWLECCEYAKENEVMAADGYTWHAAHTKNYWVWYVTRSRR